MYEQTVKLKDNEKLVKVNDETGEVSPIVKRSNYIPEGKEVFEAKGMFKKDYTKSWEYLDRVLTPLEFRVTAKLCRMAKLNTNSLEPLNDDTTIPKLVEEFNISKNKVKPLFKKLFRLGVYAKFEVTNPNVPYTKYWILNPYLSFGGKLINSDIADLFVGTIIQMEYSKK